MLGASSKRGRPNIMFQIIGIVLLFGLVFGSFIMSGGKMGVILHAAPHELMPILGAGAASLLIANSMSTIKGTSAGVGSVFKGPKWKSAD
jgi:chemotaxis protein MotA